MTAATPKAQPSIAFGGLVKLERDGWEGVPDSPNPFYFGARDGLYVHRRMLTGRGVARVPFWPDNFPKFGHDKGDFLFEANPIPAKLMGQVVNFFERTYDRQHTEAAVLLVMHSETKEWRIFVPTQLVSHGGVNYVFEPGHIRYPWVIVGSIHSHCDFGAGHSSTDTTDADTFDGLHCTIGMIKRDIPQIVAMVAMNKQLFHYKEEQFPTLFDFSEAKQHEAPAWWDRYVENTTTKTKPVGFELYAKYDRPTVVKSEKPSVKVTSFKPSPSYKSPTRNNYDSTVWVWSNQLQRMVHRDWIIHEDGTITYPSSGIQGAAKGQHGLVAQPRKHPDDWDDHFREPINPHKMYVQLREEGLSDKMADHVMAQNGYVWSDSHWSYSPKGLLKESEEFNARKAAEHGIRWKVDGELDMTGALARRMTDEDLDEYMRLFDEAEAAREQEDRFWEESIPPTLLEAIMSSELVNDEDVDYAIGNYKIAGDPEHWKYLFLKKALSAVEVLRVAGLDVKLTIASGPPNDLDIVRVAERPNEANQPQLLLLPPNTENTDTTGAH